MASAPNHGKRFLTIWIVASVIATPLVAIFLGDLLPPGDASAQATQQVFDNSWLLTISTPIFLFVLILLLYTVFSFRARTTELVDGPPMRGNARIQLLWMIITPAVVLGFSFQSVRQTFADEAPPVPVFGAIAGSALGGLSVPGTGGELAKARNDRGQLSMSLFF